MTNTSNAPASALSPHVHDLQRRLLRDVIRRSKEFLCSGELLPDDEVGTDASSSGGPVANVWTDPASQASVAAAKPQRSRLQTAFDRCQFGRPVAEEMTAAEIAAAIHAGDDPWAASTDGQHPSEDLPVRELLSASGLLRTFGSKTAVADMTAPGALTVVQVLSDDRRKDLHRDLVDIVPTFLRMAGEMIDGTDDSRLKLAVLALDKSDRTGTRGDRIVQEREISKMRSILDKHIAANAAVLLLVASTGDLTDAARAVGPKSVSWAAPRTHDIVEILRATHSMTGLLAEDAIRAALPSPDAVANLDLSLWQRAFTETSPIRVARQLAKLCAPRPRPAGPTLDDVHGQPAVRAELEGLAADVAAWKIGKLDWSEVASSLLLTGPPGTGKTMTAAALAGSAQMHFVSTSYGACQAAGHLGDYLASMSARVNEAIANAPSLFFLDEVDSYPRRDAIGGSNARYATSVVNALLTELTRLNDTPGVIVVGASNFPDNIDAAITRAGRMDRHIRLGPLDRAGIAAILRGHLGASLPDLDQEPIVNRLLGCTGADIAALARLARGFARRHGREVSAIDLDEAANQIAPKPTGTSDWETAVHEAGHIVVSAVLDLAPPRSARLTAQGGEVSIDLPDRLTRDALDRRMAAIMGGRAAEELILGSIGHASGIGSQSDLGIATRIGLKIETEYGLGQGLMHTPIPTDDRTRLPEGLRRRVERHLSNAMRRASDVVAGQEEAVRQIAEALQSERELDAERIADLTKHLRGIGETGAPVHQLQLVH